MSVIHTRVSKLAFLKKQPEFSIRKFHQKSHRGDSLLSGFRFDHDCVSNDLPSTNNTELNDPDGTWRPLQRSFRQPAPSL